MGLSLIFVASFISPAGKGLLLRLAFGALCGYLFSKLLTKLIDVSIKKAILKHAVDLSMSISTVDNYLDYDFLLGCFSDDVVSPDKVAEKYLNHGMKSVRENGFKPFAALFCSDSRLVYIFPDIKRNSAAEFTMWQKYLHRKVLEEKAEFVFTLTSTHKAINRSGKKNLQTLLTDTEEHPERYNTSLVCTCYRPDCAPMAMEIPLTKVEGEVFFGDITPLDLTEYNPVAMPAFEWSSKGVEGNE